MRHIFREWALLFVAVITIIVSIWSLVSSLRWFVIGCVTLLVLLYAAEFSARLYNRRNGKPW